MKKLFKEMFSVATKSTSYKKTIINFLLGMILPVALFVASLFIPVNSPFRYLTGALSATIMFLFFMFFCRLLFVGDNIAKRKIATNNYQFKYSPIKIELADFVFYLNNATIPETLYVKSANGTQHIFEVSFEVTGKRGSFYNKQFFLDETQLDSPQTCITQLQQLQIIKDGYVEVYETFDHNKPEILLATIQQLKNQIDTH